MIEENQRKKNNFLKCQKEYELIEARELPDIASYGYLMKHRKSKARLFLIENQDENKVFNICFRKISLYNISSAEENAPFISLYTTPL